MKLRSLIGRVFKRRHGDIYAAVSEYASRKGLKVEDVVAAACSAYLMADEEGKSELERAVRERTGNVNIKATLGLFRDFCSVMSEMFRALNEARAGMSVSALISDFKAVSESMNEIRRIGAESGRGSMEDVIGQAILTSLLSRLGASPGRRKLGSEPVEEAK